MSFALKNPALKGAGILHCLRIQVLTHARLNSGLKTRDCSLATVQETFEVPLEQAPILYKILSRQDWQESQEIVKLSPDDSEFIHFSTEEQLDRIIRKYWKDVPEFVVLKIDPKKLKGTLRFEINPGGTTKYYHLYNGSIPRDAILEVREFKN